MAEKKIKEEFYLAKQDIAGIIKTSCILAVTVLMLASCKSNVSKYTTANNTAKKVYIKKENGIYRVYKNGKPFLVKGAAGNTKIADLMACGGNTISIWDTTLLEKVLNEAEQNNVSVIAGLDVPSGDIIQFYQDDF